MARKLRVQYPGAIYHAMNRGDRRESIFNDDNDRLLFLETLGEACKRLKWRSVCFSVGVGTPCRARIHFIMLRLKGLPVALNKCSWGSSRSDFWDKKWLAIQVFRYRLRACMYLQFLVSAPNITAHGVNAHPHFIGDDFIRLARSQ